MEASEDIVEKRQCEVCRIEGAMPEIAQQPILR